MMRMNNLCNSPLFLVLQHLLNETEEFELKNLVVFFFIYVLLDKKKEGNTQNSRMATVILCALCEFVMFWRRERQNNLPSYLLSDISMSEIRHEWNSTVLAHLPFLTIITPLHKDIKTWHIFQIVFYCSHASPADSLWLSFIT